MTRSTAKAWTVIYEPSLSVVGWYESETEAVRWCARLISKNTHDMSDELTVSGPAGPTLWGESLRDAMGALEAVS